MMQRVAILCGVIAVMVATAGPGLAVLNVSIGSSVDRTFFVNDSIDEVFTMRNQGRTPVTACCFYVNRNGHCSDTSGRICFGRNSCSPRVPCIPGCRASDFRFDIPAKNRLGLSQVQWSARDGLFAIPPVSEIPFFGDLVCDIVGLGDECPGDLGANPCE